MCGIAGFAGVKNDSLIKRMTKLLAHRGPDYYGIKILNDVSLGHSRLAIVDQSKNGNQPISNEDQSVFVVFNGEIFNFLQLRRKLISKGHKFKSQTDSEVIVHAYEEDGIEAVKHFDGFFAFALWDEKKKTIYLVRDRIGVKPLYYYCDGKALYFASEIKAILENKRIERKINNNSYYQYMAFQSTLGEETLFCNIRKVAPATILTFASNGLKSKKYWELKKDFEIMTSNEQSLEMQARNLLLESVRKRVATDAPIGILLSGGLDSSSIVALASQIMSKKIKTFSVGFGKSDDEFEYARLVSQKFNTDHTELLIEPKNVGNVLTKIVWHQDEPLADGGGIATYLAAQLLSKHVKVVLVGEGGDELFGGYSWYKLGLPISSIFSESIRKKIYFYLTTFYNRRNSQFLNVFDLFNEIFESPKDDFLSRMIRFEIENILPNSLCMKVDKMMSAWGLEAREPYLDHKLVEFCFSLPINLKISANRNKIILRRIMKDLLPKGIITRRKHGFLLPTRDWLDGPLKEYSMGTILARDSFAKRIYPMSELREMLKKKKFVFEIERVNFVWRLFIFELWYKNYIKDY